MKRQIVLDTETTGISPQQGHRIIEIGCVELIDRQLTGKHYHQYINPEREIEEEAFQIHGIGNDFLDTQPVFSQIVSEFLDFVNGAQLIIHNAPFDVGFINHELNLLGAMRSSLGLEKIEDICEILDSLALAKKLHPGQKNNLDALSRRYNINTAREKHGALLDSEILADVYLAMTGGQMSLGFQNEDESSMGRVDHIQRLAVDRKKTRIIRCTDDELKAHRLFLQQLREKDPNYPIW